MAKRKRKADGREVAVGVAWYSLREWQRLKQVADDVESLDATYRDWLAGIDKLLTTLRAEQVHLRRVDMNIEELQQWCRDKNRPNTSGSRAAYVEEIIRRGGGIPL